MNPMENKSLGQIAYEAYYSFNLGKSLISGAPLPTWEMQDLRICAAWDTAADAVAESTYLKP